MFRVKKILSLILLFFISCGFHTDSGPLYPIPILKVKMGEQKTFDLSNYFIEENVDLLFNEDLSHISLNGHELTVDASIVTSDFEDISLMANGNLIHVLIQYELRVKHTFTFESETAENIVVMGGFNDWSRTALPLDKNGNQFSKSHLMDPKKHEYKFVVDGEEEIDPANPVFISNNIGGWNSILDLSHKAKEQTGSLVKKSHKGKWLIFEYLQPEDKATPQKWIVLFDNTELHADSVDPLPDGGLKVNISRFKNGLLRIIGHDSKGRIIPENQTILNNGSPLNSDSDDWHFAIIYNIMVDRFLDGNPTNNKPIHDPKLHDLANFMGGDFAGIQEKIKDGYFNDLGVNTLWISPIQKQPDSSWVEWILPNRTFSGYHGYWPVSPRKTDLRFGSNEEFQSVVQNAHRTNTKVILDFVSNHVHQNHPYYKEFPKWFGDVNLTDGRKNIRQWDGDTRLTTWFDDFIPSFDFPSAPDAINQVVEDALWWMETYNLDGFRQDAVKHVPHSFWKSLTRNSRKKFPEKDIYQIGETFGSDKLIGSYVNSSELDAQFNFSIYFNARCPFSSDKAEFSDLGRIIEENRHSFGPIHLMGNITSSHDQFRFTGYADGQMKLSDNGTARSFDDPVGKIRHKSTYSKLANFHAFNISQPGVPIIYYGEEIAMMGEGDPGNRRMMRFDLSQKEKALKKQFSQLNKLRVKYPSLAVGDQIILLSDGPVFATFKVYFDEKVLVMINQSPKNEIVNIKLPISVESLKNCLSDNSVIIKDNSIQLTLKPYSHSFYYAN